LVCTTGPFIVAAAAISVTTTFLLDYYSTISITVIAATTVVSVTATATFIATISATTSAFNDEK
jgi:hypothetical protein